MKKVSKNARENVSKNVRSRNTKVIYDEKGIKQVHTGLDYVGTSSVTNGNVEVEVPDGAQRRSVSFASASDDSVTSAGGTGNATGETVGTRLLTVDADESGLNLTEGNLAEGSQNKNNKSLDSYLSMSVLLDDDDKIESDKSSDEDS